MRLSNLGPTFPLAALGLFLFAAPPATAGDWGAQFSSPDATNRASGEAAISSEAGSEPGFLRSLSRQERTLPSVTIEDLNGDGLPEVVMLVQGSLAALDLSLGEIMWRSIPVGADGFLGRIDVDGTGERYLVTSAGIGGGAYLVNPLGGGLTPAINQLPGRSGVTAAEVAGFDLDGDGDQELVVPAGSFALAKVWTVDFQGEPAESAIVATDLSGYSNLTPARAGHLLSADGTAVVINQGAQYQLYDVCEPAAAEAVCDDVAGTLCLCDQGIFYGVHNTFSFGPGFVIDTNGDGVDEVVEVASHPRYTNAVYSLDFAAGLAGGAHAATDLRAWYRGYPAGTNEPAARLVTPTEGPVDLDGDGDLELIVSFVDNAANDVDGEGNPSDDGIDLAGGVSTAVFDLETGEVLATLENAFAYGTVDSDGDGTRELVTSPTTGWTFIEGLTGHVLDCPAACTLSEQWSAPSVSVVLDRDSLTNLSTPPASLPLTDLDGDGDFEIVGYLEAGGSASVVAAEYDGAAGLTNVAVRALDAEEEVAATYVDGPGVLIRDDSDIHLLGADLQPVGLRVKIPVQGAETMLAGFLAAGESATVIYEDFAHRPDGGTPIKLGVANPALVVDLDGDGISEVVGYSNPPDSGGEGFEVASLSWNGTTNSFDTNWSVRSDDPSLDLDGFVVTTRLNWNLGEFNGDGVDDVVFTASGVPEYRQVVLDGATGEPLHVFTTVSRPSSVGPILVDDLIDAAGDPGADGTLDILVHGSSYLEWVTPGTDGPVASSTTNFFHTVSANGDLDGDGAVDNVVMPSSVTSRIEAITNLADPEVLWFHEDVGLLPSTLQLLALADVDAAPGLDVLFITGDAELIVYSGADGTMVPGFPVHLAEGRVFDTNAAPTAPPAPTAMIAMDVDGDGFEEAVVGTEDGRVYAVNIVDGDEGAPSLAWYFQVSAAVGALAAAEMDGEPGDELLVSTRDGLVHVVGAVGVCLEIEYPAQGECVPTGEFVVRGRSCGVDSVDVFGAGAPGSANIVARSGEWAGAVTIAGEGNHTVQAYGYTANDTLLVFDQVEVLVDEDCEGERPPEETPTPAEETPPGDPPPVNCADCDDGCAMSAEVAPGLLAALLMVPAMVLSRRRRSRD